PGGVPVHLRPVTVAHGRPVHALRGEERVVLLEGLPEDVEGGAGVVRQGAGAVGRQGGDPPEPPVAHRTVHGEGGVVAVVDGPYGQHAAVRRRVGAGTRLP